MTGKIAAVFSVFAMVTLMSPALAGADRPVVNEFEIVDNFDLEDEEGEPLCGFPVHGQDTLSVRETETFNKDGSLRMFRVHVNGSTLWTNDSGAEVWENWAWTGTFDPETGNFTQNGNIWNAHMSGGGILVNDSGHVVFGPEELIVVNGPHQALEGDFSGLCGALS